MLKYKKNLILAFNIGIFIVSTTSLAAAYKGGRTPPPTCKATSSAGSSVASGTYNIASDVSSKCISAPSPSCTYGVCTAAKCLTAEEWCVEKFTPMTTSSGFNLNPNILKSYAGANNLKLVERYGLEKGKPFLIAASKDPDFKSCPRPDGKPSLKYQGGETICDIGTITSIHHKDLEDTVLTFISTFENPVFAKCSYFDPDCATCCTGWSPPVCCPPPPPPPPPAPSP